MTPHDRVCTAISILQMHILALDSNLKPEAVWGGFHMVTPALEHAVNLLTDVLDDVPDK